jgi:hypothetical protein
MIIHDEAYPKVCNVCGTQYSSTLGDICPSCGHDNDHEVRLSWLKVNSDRFTEGKVYGVKCDFCGKPIYGNGMRSGTAYSHIDCLDISWEVFRKKISSRGVWVR